MFLSNYLAIVIGAHRGTEFWTIFSINIYFSIEIIYYLVYLRHEQHMPFSYLKGCISKSSKYYSIVQFCVFSSAAKIQALPSSNLRVVNISVIFKLIFCYNYYQLNIKSYEEIVCNNGSIYYSFQKVASSFLRIMKVFFNIVSIIFLLTVKFI